MADDTLPEILTIEPRTVELINADFDYLIQDIEKWPDKDWLSRAMVSHIMRNARYALRDVQMVVHHRFKTGE